MERKAMQDLINWKNKKIRKPLLLFGARQVGKTYLVQEFGKTYFDNMIYVNFEKNNIVNRLIDENISPDYIIKNLEIIFNQKIDKENTLIFFDEIQSNPRALTSLKYFCEETPEYHIIGAGSLLGVKVKEKNFSFPVGKVEFLTIYPLSFEEFLNNTGNSMLCEQIKSCYKLNNKMDETLHEKALNMYYEYLTIGGMPEVVREYITSSSVISAIEYQNDIIESYKNDITKYCEKPSDANKILAAFSSIPVQLAKENKKFQYKFIQKGGTSAIFGESIEWLVNAGIVHKCVKTKIGIPLKMYEELENFKLYTNDVGILTNLSELPLYFIKNSNVINESMLGMLTENYVASCLKYNGLNLHYWKNDYESEVDFIIQTKRGDIIPLEVKSGNNVKSRSLTNYINEFNPRFSIRISIKNFGFVNNIKSVPLYAVFCITDENLEKEAC